LVALTMVAGPKFDYSSWQYYGRLGQIFTDMAALTKDKSVPPRSRFLIRDVLDAREAGWPSKLGGDKSPSKLEEVRNASVAPLAGNQGPTAIDFCLMAFGDSGKTVAKVVGNRR